MQKKESQIQQKESQMQKKESQMQERELMLQEREEHNQKREQRLDSLIQFLQDNLTDDMKKLLADNAYLDHIYQTSK